MRLEVVVGAGPEGVDEDVEAGTGGDDEDNAREIGMEGAGSGGGRGQRRAAVYEGGGMMRIEMRTRKKKKICSLFAGRGLPVHAARPTGALH